MAFTVEVSIDVIARSTPATRIDYLITVASTSDAVICGVSQFYAVVYAPVRVEGGIHVQPCTADASAARLGIPKPCGEHFLKIAGGVQQPISESCTDIAGIQRFESVLFKVGSNCVFAGRPVFFAAEVRAHGGELWERQAGVR